jgi:hypothetical protein
LHHRREIGRYCAATALTWNMHTCTCLWTGALADDLDLPTDERAQHRRRRALHCRRVVDEGALYAQPFSEGGVYDGTARMTPFETAGRRVAGGGWRITGRIGVQCRSAELAIRPVGPAIQSVCRNLFFRRR